MLNWHKHPALWSNKHSLQLLGYAYTYASSVAVRLSPLIEMQWKARSSAVAVVDVTNSVKGAVFGAQEQRSAAISTFTDWLWAVRKFFFFPFILWFKGGWPPTIWVIIATLWPRVRSGTWSSSFLWPRLDVRSQSSTNLNFVRWSAWRHLCCCTTGESNEHH